MGDGRTSGAVGLGGRVRVVGGGGISSFLRFERGRTALLVLEADLTLSSSSSSRDILLIVFLTLTVASLHRMHLPNNASVVWLLLPRHEASLSLDLLQLLEFLLQQLVFLFEFLQELVFLLHRFLFNYEMLRCVGVSGFGGFRLHIDDGVGFGLGAFGLGGGATASFESVLFIICQSERTLAVVSICSL